VEDAYFGPIVNVLREEAELSEEASQSSKEKQHQIKMVRARLFQLDHSLLFRNDTQALCHPVDMWSDVMLEAHNSALGGGHQRAETMGAAIALRCHWPN
jgi:hypothetical protein